MKTTLSFIVTKEESKTIEQIARKVGMNKSEMIRKMIFNQLDEDNLDWCWKYARNKGVDLWTWVNVVLRTFKVRCLEADAKKRLNHMVLAEKN